MGQTCNLVLLNKEGKNFNAILMVFMSSKNAMLK